MQTWAPWSAQYIQLIAWLIQLLLAHAPQLDPDWYAHWVAILSGNHFAGEYWHYGPEGFAYWWADLMDTLLDLILPFRADH